MRNKVTLNGVEYIRHGRVGTKLHQALETYNVDFFTKKIHLFIPRDVAETIQDLYENRGSRWNSETREYDNPYGDLSVEEFIGRLFSRPRD